MRLGEVRLVQHGAAQACYQPITGPAWQSRGLGEEGRGGRWETLHYQCTCSVWLWWRGCGAVGVCVHAERGNEAREWVGVWLHFSSFVLGGITRCLYCIFAPHDLQIFFPFYTFLLPLCSFSPPAPSTCCASAALAREERQNSCGSAEQFPINQGIMQAGNSNKMQMSGRARLQPNTSPSTRKKKPDGSLQTAGPG